MNNKERGESIRHQIIRDVRHHPTDLVKHITTIFSITPQAVNAHLQRLEKEEWLHSIGTGKGKKYFLGDKREHKATFPLTHDFTEDAVWRNEYSFLFEGLPSNIVDICQYGFTEMVNNAIDHSGGTQVHISVIRDQEKVVISVVDNGEGIFQKIKRLCHLPDDRQALLELAKGKLTTDPAHHSGEGIFFTSRLFDTFEINSKGVTFSHSAQHECDYIVESEYSVNEAFAEVGTAISMLITRGATRLSQTVFDEYAAPDAYRFNKTVIPVRLAQYDNEKLISRSQAKRLLTRIERFEHVVLDFDKVSDIGQAFADEIFRVYVNHHPHIELLPINMALHVEKMVQRAIALQREQSENN